MKNDDSSTNSEDWEVKVVVISTTKRSEQDSEQVLKDIKNLAKLTTDSMGIKFIVEDKTELFDV